MKTQHILWLESFVKTQKRGGGVWVGGRVGHRSISCTMIRLQRSQRKERKEILPGVPLFWRLPPASPHLPLHSQHQHLNKNLWPPEDVIIKLGCERSPDFQTSHLILIFYLIWSCDLLCTTEWMDEGFLLSFNPNSWTIPPPPLEDFIIYQLSEIRERSRGKKQEKGVFANAVCCLDALPHAPPRLLMTLM